MHELVRYAVTVYRPWGYAISRLGKPVENRPYRCHLEPGTLIAIHNGQRWERSALKAIRAITGHSPLIDKASDPAQAIIAIARFTGNCTTSESPWFSGPFGWELAEVLPINPICCPGQQRIWRLEGRLQQHVQQEYQAALTRSLIV